MDAIVAKIQRLLALAQSDNEHEARAAAEKAQELLVKYNLDLQEVKGKDMEYVEMNVAQEPYLRWHQPFIIDILQDFFFVQIIWHNVVVDHTVDGRRKFRKDIMLFGTKTNVKVAHYVFDYLSAVYQRLWLEYKQENNLGEKSRKSYYRGLTQGLTDKLRSTRKKVENERGLVLVKDAKLDERANKAKTHHNPYKTMRDALAEMDGFEDGQSIQISKPLGGDVQQSGRALTGKKAK